MNTWEYVNLAEMKRGLHRISFQMKLIYIPCITNQRLSYVGNYTRYNPHSLVRGVHCSCRPVIIEWLSDTGASCNWYSAAILAASTVTYMHCEIIITTYKSVIPFSKLVSTFSYKILVRSCKGSI